jgi:hypothetical protein
MTYELGDRFIPTTEDFLREDLLAGIIMSVLKARMQMIRYLPFESGGGFPQVLDCAGANAILIGEPLEPM